MTYSGNQDSSIIRVKADPEGVSGDDRRRSARNLAGAIVHALRNNGEISVRCFGNSAVGKGAKSLAIAREFMLEHNLSLYCAPAFIDTEMDDGVKTGLSFSTFAEEGKLNAAEKLESTKQLRVKADGEDVSSENRRDAMRKLAGSIANALREHGEVQVRCFGSLSIGKAVKALAVARGFVAVHGKDLYCTPLFIETEMNGEKRTGISFYVFVGG
jgi:stage V sporulation protein S